MSEGTDGSVPAAFMASAEKLSREFKQVVILGSRVVDFAKNDLVQLHARIGRSCSEPLSTPFCVLNYYWISARLVLSTTVRCQNVIIYTLSTETLYPLNTTAQCANNSVNK